MPSQPHLPRMPRVYLIRHGQTEWSLNGRHVRLSLMTRARPGRRPRIASLHRGADWVLFLGNVRPWELFHDVYAAQEQTGTTDIPLTDEGQRVLERLGKQIVGDGSERRLRATGGRAQFV